MLHPIERAVDDLVVFLIDEEEYLRQRFAERLARPPARHRFCGIIEEGDVIVRIGTNDGIDHRRQRNIQKLAMMFFLHCLRSGNSWFVIASREQLQLTDATLFYPDYSLPEPPQ